MPEKTFIPKIDPQNPLPVLDETIEDIDASTKSYIGKHYRAHTIIAVSVAIAFEIFVIGWAARNSFSGFGELTFYILLAPIVILCYLYARISDKVKHAFYYQFAKANGYTYQKHEEVTPRSGFLFNIGHSKKIANVVSGIYQNFPLKIFNYRYTVGHGKSAQTFYFTVCEIRYPMELPHIFLQDRDHLFGKSLRLSFKNEQQISLEGDFDKYFALLAPQGWQVEALQIFAPDFMLKMRDNWDKFSLEFIGSQIYIYHKWHIKKKKTLQDLYELTQHLITNLGPVLSRMEKSHQATKAYFKNEL